ncbi:unnamed protein product [Orchesella dallaii]|uniref:Uncharacterized protein n=1 Tax=Orchesella dallaii TaxID=48710 RepID=A0ABP1QPW9_9HEXA
MSLCITSNYGVIAFYRTLPKILIVFMGFTTIFVSFLITFMVRNGSLPVVASDKLVHLWVVSSIGKMDRTQLKDKTL